MQGHYYWEYFETEHVDKPMDTIYADLDRFTWESAAGVVPGIMYSHVILPPLRYRGRFLKGLLMCSDADFLLRTWPQTRELFVVLANSRCAAIPWSREADALCSLYANPEREAAFRRRCPERACRELVPTQDADWTHEYETSVYPAPARDIDILCVSRLTENKNLPLICAALHAYWARYGPVYMTLTGMPDMPWDGLHGTAAEIFEAMNAALGPYREALVLVDYLDKTELNRHYARAGVYLLGALLEGKNRGINEALCCDTPVVCFDKLNQHARGTTALLPEGAGLTCAYDPMALAETLHRVLREPHGLTPRAAYLREGGRRHTLNLCLDHLRYYRQQLPEYMPGRHDCNLWLDLAAHATYGMSLHDLLYSRDFQGWRYMGGVAGHSPLLDACYDMFKGRRGVFAPVKL